MDSFIAKQPIFDHHENVYAYELLFRAGLENAFTWTDPDEASAKVMADSSLLMGIEQLADGRPVFINATRDILLNEYFFMLPKERVTIEVLETVEPDAEVVGMCRRLKEAGYTLALDDFVYRDEMKELVELADIIKVDFLVTTGAEERRALVERFRRDGLSFLAEKVESRQDFDQAREFGYHYSQGYFFSQPQIVSAKAVPAFKPNLLRVMSEVQKPSLDFDRLSELVKVEMSLTYKLLRYINSALFALSNKVNSIKHAMVMLGEAQFRKWVSFICLAGMGEDKPDELVVTALARAMLCEALAPRISKPEWSDRMFLLGLFSMLDAIMDRPLPELLDEMPIEDEIKAALLGDEGPLNDICRYVLAYERGRWEEMAELGQRLELDEDGLPETALDALTRARDTLSEIRPTPENAAAAAG